MRICADGCVCASSIGCQCGECIIDREWRRVVASGGNSTNIALVNTILHHRACIAQKTHNIRVIASPKRYCELIRSRRRTSVSVWYFLFSMFRFSRSGMKRQSDDSCSCTTTMNIYHTHKTTSDRVD